MNYERECEEIRNIITRARRKGRVRVWPEELKRRVLRLCEMRGATLTAAAIEVNESMISRWKSELPVEDVVPAEMASLAVTRVSVSTSARVSGATLEFAEGRLVLHSDELALAVARELLGRKA